MKPPYAYKGGKRRLLSAIGENIPDTFGNYFEPFLGAGAVAVYVMENYPDRHYYLSDWNPHIPPTWLAIQYHLDELLENLEEHWWRSEESYFYALRNQDRFGKFGQMNVAEIGARFIYICQHSFGGGYSLNDAGHSTNSYAHSKEPSLSPVAKNLRELSALLNDRNVHIYRRDFNKVAEQMKAGDLIYLDPPYLVEKTDEGDKYQGHDNYIKIATTAEITQQVYGLMDTANSHGTYALASNATTPTTEELWKGWNRFKTSVVWTGGANRNRPASEENLWGNNALYRVLTADPKELPEPGTLMPRQTAQDGPQKR